MTKLTGMRGIVLSAAAMAAAMHGQRLSSLGHDILTRNSRDLEPGRPESEPDELGYTPRQYAENEERARKAAAKRERRKARNLRIAGRAALEDEAQ